MTNYPPTPAFGGFPLPAPKGPPGLSQDLRKLSINSIGSNNTTLPSPAILSPNYLPKFPNSSSASRQQLSSPPSTVPITSPNPMHAPLSELNKQGHRSDDGLLDDREEGELSDAEDHEAPNINRRNNHSDSRQRDRNTQNQQGREFTLHGMRTSSEAPNHSPIARSQTWNESYRRDSTSQGWNQQGSNRKRSFDLSSAGPPKAPRGDQHERKFDPPSQPKGMGGEKGRAGDFRDHKSPGSSNVTCPPPGPKNQPPFHSTTATKGTHMNNSPVHISAPQSPLQTPKTAAELRSEAQRAVLNMLPLKVTFKYMVEEAGIDANVLKKVFDDIGLPPRTEKPSPSPSGDIDHPHRGVAKHKSREKSSDRMEIDKEAQSIRKQLEKDARDRERREAEAKAAELVRQREAAKAEEEKKRRLAEVEAKKEVLRRKIDEMKLPGKSASPGTPLTPISSTPVMEAIARVSAVPPPKPEMPRIPGLLLGQLDGCYSDTSSSPELMSEQCDTIMKDSPEPAASQSPGHSAATSTIASNISTGPAAVPSPERPLTHRRKRPVASDMYSEPMPTTKRKFGDQRKVPIELIINISDEEEEEEEEKEEEEEHTGDDSRTSRSTPSGTDSKKSTANGNNSPPRLHHSHTAPVGGLAVNGTHSKLDSVKALQDKEEQIRALKEAIQKAQQMKKMRAKTGMSTPTPVGTPTFGTGPSIPPPVTQQQQVTDIAVAVSSALDSAKKADETTRQKEEKQKILLAQAAHAKAKAEAMKLKESQKKEKEEKMRALLTEIEEIEKAEAEKRRKKVEEAEAAEKRRQQAKEEMERKLKEAEDERQKSKMALMRIQQEFERMQREESEMEARKDALKAELVAMEKAFEQTVDAMGEGGDEAVNQAIARKKEEIERLKKAMDEGEVDQTNFEAVISSVSSASESSATLVPGLQLARPNVKNFELDKSDVQGDTVMVDNMDTRVNGRVDTYQQPRVPVLERAEHAASHVPAASLPMSADTLGDAMELDQQVNEEEKVFGNDVYTDVDMDARSDEGGGQEENKVISVKSNNEADGPEKQAGNEEETEPGQGPKPQVLDTRYLPTSIPVTSLEPILQKNVAAPKLPGKIPSVEEANAPISEPGQRRHIKELVDPVKIITSTTATTSDVKKQEQKQTQRQPEHVFTPYKSPLTNFKSFRYHPNFLDFCPGGYKSLTFSNRINPLKPLCRWELSGGTCSDTSCPGQHQKQLEVPDDEILVELASVVEGSNEEERNNYNRGLRQAIAAMREQGIKDFQTVVAGIASYRRRFLGDETRVLRLPYAPVPHAPPPQQPQQRVPSSFSSYT